MKKIYIEKIRQATRFGLVDEDGRKTPCGTLWSDARGQEKLCKLGTFGQNAPMKEFVEAATATAHDNKCCATCGHYGCVNRRGQINCGMGVCTLVNRDRYCLFKCGDWSMQ